MGSFKEAFNEIPLRQEPIAYNARFAGDYEAAKRASDPAYAAEATRLGLARIGKALATIAKAMAAENGAAISKKTAAGGRWMGTAGTPLYVVRNGARVRWHYTMVFASGDVAVGAEDRRGRWTDPWGVRIA